MVRVSMVLVDDCETLVDFLFCRVMVDNVSIETESDEDMVTAEEDDLLKVDGRVIEVDNVGVTVAEKDIDSVPEGLLLTVGVREGVAAVRLKVDTEDEWDWDDVWVAVYVSDRLKERVLELVPAE